MPLMFACLREQRFHLHRGTYLKSDAQKKDVSDRRLEDNVLEMQRRMCHHNRCPLRSVGAEILCASVRAYTRMCACPCVQRACTGIQKHFPLCLFLTSCTILSCFHGLSSHHPLNHIFCVLQFSEADEVQSQINETNLEIRDLVRQIEALGVKQEQSHHDFEKVLAEKTHAVCS